MNLSLLKNAGLADGEIKIYETLMDNGGLFAGRIIELSGLKRGDCYNKIYDLVQKGLVLESTKNKKKYFELAAPESIETYIDNQLENYTTTQKEIRAVLPEIISSYNLAYHKPGVKFFEGEEGLRKIIDDSLKAKTAIYSYIDSETLNKNYKRENLDYISSRRKKHVFKKIIVEDTAFTRSHFKKTDKYTDVHFMDFPLGQFSSIMHIYDNKVTYLNIKPQTMIGFLIEDETIARMHRKLFEFTWEQTEEN